MPPPVLCFNSVDLLHPEEVDAHTRIVAFLQTLRCQCACLFVGQRPVIEVDEQYSLEGLNPSSLAQLLTVSLLELTPDDLDQLSIHTNGNSPSCLSLYWPASRGRANRKSTSNSVEYIAFDRGVWLIAFGSTSISNAEQTLYELSPFRRPAPADAWDSRVIPD